MKIQDIQFGVKYTVEVKDGFEMFDGGVYPNCEVEQKDDHTIELSLEGVDEDAYEDIDDEDIIVFTQEDLDNGNIKITS